MMQNNSAGSNLSKEQLQKLTAVAGDHAASEAEWIQACALLGDYQPKAPAKKRNQPLYIGLFMLLAVGGATSLYSCLTREHQPLPGTLQPVISNPKLSPAVTLTDVDFGPYMANMQRRIKRAWFPPKGQESHRVVVLFKVSENGALSDLRLQHPSGSAVADQAALKAVADAAPFRRLPVGASPSVDIQFTFDYNVFQNNHSNVWHPYRAHNDGHTAADNAQGDQFETRSYDAFSSTASSK